MVFTLVVASVQEEKREKETQIEGQDEKVEIEEPIMK